MGGGALLGGVGLGHSASEGVVGVGELFEGGALFGTGVGQLEGMVFVFQATFSLLVETQGVCIFIDRDSNL